VLRHVHTAAVPNDHLGLLFIDGRLVDTIGPRTHGWWTFNRTVKVVHVDLRLRAMEVGGQDVLSKDKVTLRVNMTASFRVTDPVRAKTSLEN
jgi:regulator of protease activity HflC (stomatin/prohibitin superfamily)